MNSITRGKESVEEEESVERRAFHLEVEGPKRLVEVVLKGKISNIIKTLRSVALPKILNNN